MKYALVKVSNGSYEIVSETTDINSAKVRFHNTAASLWNAPDVNTACIMIVDENLDVVQGFKEFISHLAEPEPEPEPSEV